MSTREEQLSIEKRLLELLDIPVYESGTSTEEETVYPSVLDTGAYSLWCDSLRSNARYIPATSMDSLRRLILPMLTAKGYELDVHFAGRDGGIVVGYLSTPGTSPYSLAYEGTAEDAPYLICEAIVKLLESQREE